MRHIDPIKRINMRRLTAMMGAVFIMALGAGCATLTGGDRDGSDQPWNQPQPWEGSPFIPGMERY